MRDIDKIISQIQEVSAATEKMSGGTEEANASFSLITDTANTSRKRNISNSTINSITSSFNSRNFKSIQQDERKGECINKIALKIYY
ncbi:hypothetical protein AT268_13885 [Bacillus cereus]|uniref:Methyl-accepting chemotaxis protein n=1 Tax=Bacillus cereus TaxID=1396 RepID=A0A9X0MHA4_BACCE|nr:hypothetical protein AT268_13885 [Bacillus cereus]OUB33030.1 hypothetical protein BK739_05435 [Bacillus thuringiensis serovar pirenaica]